MFAHINPLLSLCLHVPSSWDNAQIDIEICATALNIVNYYAFAIQVISIYELSSAQSLLCYTALAGHDGFKRGKAVPRRLKQA